MTWISHDAGERPLVLVGAGFPLAVLDPATQSPSTADLLEVTARNCPDIFPIIKRLIDGPIAKYNNLTPNRNLNYVWTHITEFAKALLQYYEEILSAYTSEIFNNNQRITNLLTYLVADNPPLSFLNTMLGIELKKAIAHNYNSSQLLKFKVNQDIKENLILSRQVKQVTWISLNYDIILESLIDECKYEDWAYCFTEWITDLPQDSSKHVIVKPHGSVNVWFKTVWDALSKPLTHSLEFADPQDFLRTCPSHEIGCDALSQGRYEEYRPWLIGYLPDYMKDEHNTPGYFADCAHDLCKANLTYAALSLYHATSVFILGYSMPSEDQWIWNRFAALPRKDFPVYVASKGDSDRIVKEFKNKDFNKIVMLNNNGEI